MPSITEFLTGPDQGWTHEAGADFYYPPGQDIPHLHLKVMNAQDKVAGYASLRIDKKLVYFGLTHLPKSGNLDFFTNGALVDTAALPDEDIRAAIAAIATTSWNAPQKGNVRTFINSITGRNV